ncbi:hypothetical protein [Micromonospora marina]|uniref:hypothetical protein n=1 Tax=Micromonospora marina TaxID=307120 RepID=UPI000B1CB1FB
MRPGRGRTGGAPHPVRTGLLVAATITYNVIEAVVAISAGTAAPSTALIGCGAGAVNHPTPYGP